jgi:hypothetical protein
MALTGIELSAGIVVGANKPVDAKFGPYASTAAALADIGSTLRYKGLTVGIENAGQVVEYWFRNGVANADLVEKITPLEATNIIGLSDFIVAAAPGLSINSTIRYGNGTSVTFPIDGIVSNDPESVLVALNGVTQAPVTDYSVSEASGTITFDAAPAAGTQIACTALGLRTVQPPIDPTLYLFAFDSSLDGLTTYSGRLLNANRPAAPALPETASTWTIKRSTLNAAGRVLSTAQATGSWANRESLSFQ